MTVYVLKYTIDYGDEGTVREAFSSKAEAVAKFRELKRLAKEDEENALDEARMYHIRPDNKAENFIRKYVVHNTKDLINLINRI
jgi:hypothetical protein